MAFGNMDSAFLGCSCQAESIYILPLVTFIEVLSFFSRPLSHSVRLFANILAGHITLYVFGGFVTMLGALGVVGWFGATIPIAMTVAVMALELLVAFLQAYVLPAFTSTMRSTLDISLSG
jgi:F-type H+-transporting ATPase subunit a